MLVFRCARARTGGQNGSSGPLDEDTIEVKEFDEQANLRGLSVVGGVARTLGTVDGFIVDEASARPYHVVVNAGGWFTHKRFLVPIGHVSLGGSTLTADLTKERVKRFPGFDKREFEKLSSRRPEQDERRAGNRLLRRWCDDCRDRLGNRRSLSRTAVVEGDLLPLAGRRPARLIGRDAGSERGPA